MGRSGGVEQSTPDANDCSKILQGVISIESSTPAKKKKQLLQHGTRLTATICFNDFGKSIKGIQEETF